MIIIPAIDLRGGRCVRLLEGKADAETVYSDDPVALAKEFLAAGAERIHVVDLDGAFAGEPKQTEAIAAIAQVAEIEVGGGLRDRAGVERVLAAGAKLVMLGTVIVEKPDLFRELCRDYPGRIAAAIDAKNGKVAVRGWVDVTEIDVLDIARQCEEAKAAAIAYTDIARDGTGKGVNVAATAELAEKVSLPVIASGGVRDLDDVRALRKTKVAGVIIGRAIYEKKIDLREAIRGL